MKPNMFCRLSCLQSAENIFSGMKLCWGPEPWSLSLWRSHSSKTTLVPSQPSYHGKQNKNITHQTAEDVAWCNGLHGYHPSLTNADKSLFATLVIQTFFSAESKIPQTNTEKTSFSALQTNKSSKLDES